MNEIIQKKIFDSVLDIKFVVFFLLATGLLMFSTFSGYVNYEEQRDAYERNLGQLPGIMANRGSYYLLLSDGITLRRPPELLSVFYRGVSSSTGQSAPINDAANVSVVGSRNGRQPLFAAIGDIDYGFVFQYIFSLFAIVLAFDAVCGEREQGTLKLILSNPLNRVSFILGTAAGGILVLWMSVLLPILLSVLMLTSFFSFTFSTAQWILFCCLVGANLLYLAVFYLTGLMVSSLNKSNFYSFLYSLAIWVVIVAIVPVFSIEIASRISPAPSIDELEAEIAALKRENAVFHRDLLNELMIVTLEVDAGDREALSEAVSNARSIAKEKFLKAEENVHRKYIAKQIQLASLAKNISRISPASVINYAGCSLAGSDESLLNRFLESARKYRVDLIEYAIRKGSKNRSMNMKGIGRSMMNKINDEGILEEVDVRFHGPNQKIDVSDVPDFEPLEISTEQRVIAALPDLMILALEAVVLLLMLVISFNRYDVR